MAQEKFGTDDNTEYQFNEAEDAVLDDHDDDGQQTMNAPSSGGGFFRNNTKKIIVVLVFICLVFLVIYKVTKFIKSRRVQSQSVASITIKTRPTIPVAAPKSTVLIPTKTSSQKMITNIQHQLKQNEARLSAFENKLTQINNSVKGTQHSVGQIAKQMQDNANLRVQLAALKKKTAATRASKVRKLKRYYVEAVIPGRVWLRGADGTTMTVAVNDEISGYGKVTSIDPYSGIVTTSSGIKIYYGINTG